MDYRLLRSSIEEQPETLAWWEAGDNGTIADWFNEPDRADVPVTSITKAQFMVFALPVLAAIRRLPIDEREDWRALINFGVQADTIDVNLPEIRGVFQAAVEAGLITADKVTALTTRRGSRAEKLFGRNLTYDDIRAAREVA